ncbi:MAG: TrmH family RNA methyltransferase [Exilispira sp.]
MNFYIILVGNEFAGNAGQVARVMGNFDFENLVLVNPAWDDPTQGLVFSHTPEGLNIFDRRKTFKDLDEAIKKLNLTTTIAFTRRSGKTRQINYSHREYFSKFFEKLKSSKILYDSLNIGLIFGREKNGLTSEEIDKCSVLVYIPASAKSPSLNLSQSVAIILETIYHERSLWQPEKTVKIKPQIHQSSTQIERESFYKDIIEAAKKRKLFIKNDEKSFRRLFERIFSSPDITSKDLSLLKAMLMRFIYADYIYDFVDSQNDN